MQRSRGTRQESNARGTGSTRSTGNAKGAGSTRKTGNARGAGSTRSTGNVRGAGSKRNTGNARGAGSTRNTSIVRGGRNTDKSKAANQKRYEKGSAFEAPISVSQNFITSQKLIHRIVRLSGIGKKDTVYEIGTGKGHLTEALCKEAGYVHSIEIDRKLYETAGKRLSEPANLHLICGDFLKYKLPDEGDYVIFANIPYSITTQIIEKLTNTVNQPRDIWLIMEKGAAKRWMGLPGETEKSLRMKVYWNSEIRYFFRREDFHPMPSVDSVLVHFSLKPEPGLSRNEYRDFCRFVDKGMKHGICGKSGLLTNRQAQAALKRAGLPHAHEDGVTLYIQWLCLFRCWQSLRKG